jgi:hypothetical protein
MTWHELSTVLEIKAETHIKRKFHIMMQELARKEESTLIDELAMIMNTMDFDTFLKLLKRWSWSGDAKLLWKQLRCILEWTSESRNLFSRQLPNPGHYVINLKALLTKCLDYTEVDRFDVWTKLLCWKFCSKCGRRFPSSDNHLSTISSCENNCRHCDQTPDFMEQARRLKQINIAQYKNTFFSDIPGAG